MNLSWLRPVYESGADGPFVTVYLDASRTDEAGARKVELRWRSARDRLAEAGAPAGLLDALESAAGTPTGEGGANGLALVGAGDRVLLRRVMPRPPARESASWSPLPHLMPLVRQEALTVPYVLLVADRQGADVTVVGPHGEQLESHKVESTDEVIRKVPQGGWSTARYQRRVEDSWEKNGAEVARDLDRVVARHGAQLVLVTGDVRATAALLEHIGERTRKALVELQHGSRVPGASLDGLQEELEEVVAERATTGVVGVLDRYEQERGRGGAAAEGLAEVVDAVRRAQVETLLLHDDPSATTTLWVGPEPLQIGLTREELGTLGVAQPREDRADAAIVRALTANDAGLVLVPPGRPELRDGIGAVLRYVDAATS